MGHSSCGCICWLTYCRGSCWLEAVGMLVTPTWQGTVGGFEELRVTPSCLAASKKVRPSVLQIQGNEFCQRSNLQSLHLGTP